MNNVGPLLLVWWRSAPQKLVLNIIYLNACEDYCRIVLLVRRFIVTNNHHLHNLYIGVVYKVAAVDPLHKIMEVKRRVEKDFGVTFYLHVDAAWGGNNT